MAERTQRASAGGARREVGGALWPHVLALLVGLAVVWPMLELDSVFISDEGSYGLQAEVLSHGGWDMGYPFSEVDPDVTYPAHYASRVADGRVVPYAEHPLWPVSLAAAQDVLGEDLGLRIIGVASLVVLALVAAALARDLGGPGSEIWAFWLAATSSVLAQAWMLWAHAPSAAAGGLLILAAVRSRRRWPWLVVAASAAAVGVLLRSEGVLWAAAVGGGVLITGRDRRALGMFGAIGVATFAAQRLETRWINDILGGAAPGSDLTARGGGAGPLDRLSGLRRVLIDGAFVSQPAKLLGLAIVLLAAAAVVLLHREGPSVRSRALLAVTAGAMILRLVIEPHDPAPGLVVVAPALLLCVLWRPARPEHLAVPAAVLLFLGALALTIYPNGGSFQWGGRFLSPMVAAVAAMAGVAASSLVSSGESRRSWRYLTAPLAALIAVQAVATVVSPDAIRRNGKDGIETVTSLGPSVLVANGRQIARLDWQGWPQRCWIATPQEDSPADLEAIIDVLARSGVETATYVGFDREQLETAGVTVLDEAEGLSAGVMQMPDPAEDRSIAEPFTCST